MMGAARKKVGSLMKFLRDEHKARQGRRESAKAFGTNRTRLQLSELYELNRDFGYCTNIAVAGKIAMLCAQRRKHGQHDTYVQGAWHADTHNATDEAAGADNTR